MFSVALAIGPMLDAQDRPGVSTTLDGVCKHESHEHSDEDLRVRQAVLIDTVDQCGFTYTTKTETARLETTDDTIVAEGPDGVLGQLGSVTILSRSSIRPHRVAMIFFCQYCKHAITVRLTTRRKDE